MPGARDKQENTLATALITHADCFQHVTPQGHPEQVARLIAIEQRLESSEFDTLLRRDAPLCKDADILKCHGESYLRRVRAAEPNQGYASLDADTHLSHGSVAAARRAVGANLLAVDMVLSATAQNAFVACRPPGHHAESDNAMGFCLFGNVSIAAKYALDNHGLDRVAIIDFDVHHGNGTQDLLWNEPRALFCSSHQMPLFPGSGGASETGATGNALNMPLRAGSRGEDMRLVYQNEIFPAVAKFDPDLIFVSAGFDAHTADPLANLNWDETDYVWLTEQICLLARKCCDGRVVSTLEGGYDLTALANSVAAHVGVLMGTEE